MRKKVSKALKRAMAVAAMAAAVAVTVPSLAMAGTAPDKGCTGNTSTGYHDYRMYCLGFSHYTTGQHKNYATVLDRILKTDNWSWCNTRMIYYGTKEICQYCGKLTGGRGSHEQMLIHLDCDMGSESHNLCTGIGCDVTFLN